MSSRGKPKGKNLAVDNWLESIGLYRKNVPYDETCLFRAVSEQLFDCQIYHERVRKECIDYARVNFFKFWNLLDEENWFDHLELLEKHMVVCGDIEIRLISEKYDRDVIVYDATNKEIKEITQIGSEEKLLLCLMNEDHYDVVYKIEHIQTAGFCQSIVYNILYENVFEMPNVQDIVHGMLYTKQFVSPSFAEVNNNLDIKPDPEKVDDDTGTGGAVAPFPFKVAKALDPTMYRNIEYDAWTEVRKELRLGDWYYGDDNLILGTRCILNQQNEPLECYIQDIIKNQNKCVVYVVKLAQKLTVKYSDLSPEDDAKPWPLPFRFTKNLAATSTVATPPIKPPKIHKKRKDRSRAKSESQTVASSEQVQRSIDALIGIPLQKQCNISGRQETSPKKSQHNLLVTPDIPSPAPTFSWETPWTNTASGSSDNFIWSQPPATPPGVALNVKPMVASAPVTPNIVPYHNPFVYNYQVDSTPSYNPFHDTTDFVTNAQYTPESEENIDGYAAEPPPQMYSHTQEPQTHRERPTLHLPPPSSQVDVFSPVIPIPPGTPVIYAHSTEVPDMMVHVPSYQVYTPPVEGVNYVSPVPYFYSPAIPAPWYPTEPSSQGFYFPPPGNQN